MHLVADVAGWYAGGTPSTGGALTAVAPTRLLDTRESSDPNAGAVAAGGQVTFQVTGGTVPANAAAALLNITVTGTSAPGHITAHPAGTSAPLASNLNFVARQTIANAVTVRLGDGGRVTLVNGSTHPVHLVADLAGWVASGSLEAGGTFQAVDPVRALDTRTTRAVPAGGFVDVQVTGEATGVPAGAGAAVLNVTATRATAPGHVTAHPAGTSAPLASNLNFVAGQTIPNQVTVKLSSDGRVRLTNGSTAPVHLIVDVSGAYRAADLQPTVNYHTTSSSPDGVAFRVNGYGFTAVTNPGDNGVYVGLAEAGGLPPVDDRENTDLFAGVAWVMPSSFSGDTWVTSFVADPEKLDPTKSYSLYTWQAHTHSNTTQDTETPVVIDWASLG